MTGLFDRIMDWSADQAAKSPKIIWYSLITGATLTTSDATYNTYNGRKFSDYDVILFVFGVDDTDTRGTAIINQPFWTSGKQIVESILHGSAASSASSYSVGTISTKYQSDTSITARCTGSGVIKRLQVLGGKIENR